MNYGQSYINLSKKALQFHSVVGLDLEKFKTLCLKFNLVLKAYESEYCINGEKRTRSPSSRKDFALKNTEDKLYFILIYLKNNPLQQTHASNWGMTQPKANVWIHYLLPILLQTLEIMQLVPEDTSENFEELLKDVNTLYLDGVERNIQRPKHKEEQKWHYSGKKNAYRQT